MQGSQLFDKTPTGNGVFDLLDDTLDRLRLVDEPVCPQPHCLNATFVTTGAGINNDRGVDAALLQAAQDLETIDPRHFEIEDEAINGLTGQKVERLVATRGNDGVVFADAFQIVGILLGHRRNVVDHQDVRRHVRVRVPAGMSTVMRVPLPGSLSTPMVPCRSITSLRTMESPSPVPPSFVV